MANCPNAGSWSALLLTCLFTSTSTGWCADLVSEGKLPIGETQRIALVGNSTAERMSLFGHFETRLLLRFADRHPKIRNFGWPGESVSVQQRPGNYDEIDDPFLVFQPNLLICFFGFNESFDGSSKEQLDTFVNDYRAYIDDQRNQLATSDGPSPKFVLVSPIAFEPTGNQLQPEGSLENARLGAYTEAIANLAGEDGHHFVDLFHPTLDLFLDKPGKQFTINGIHLNDAGDQKVAAMLDASLFAQPQDLDAASYDRIRSIVNEKSWLHSQDYRMLNGWYVYGGRRTWDTETFPSEFRKIRNMVAVRDAYLWNLASGKPVPDSPDDSQTGDVVIPETMFGSRDDDFRRMREPTTLDYPTPEDSISQMTVPEGFEVQLFASEREFPELANPTQIAFDNKGRLWVACMESYPQWLPGSTKPDDRLLIFEDSDNDGKADQCKVFYDKLVCPTGFEFYEDGVLVVDEPRILFLRDTDGDDRADEVTQLLDGIGTDDTHHAMGAWEYSPGGLLHMLEGIALSTTLETPWGPRRQQGSSGSYVWDIDSARIRHFRTPGHYNPWCLVFDRDGNGIIGDGTNANQHWTNPLSGGEVRTRSSLDPVFDNEGIRPAAGNELLVTRQFPEEFHDQLIYACVINMHGLPAFRVRDDAETCGLTGERTDDLLSSTDMFFRPVDPKIGPDGALWFGDWCNALIGHMQYSQRDPNRDHEHGRVYRLVYKDAPRLPKVTQWDSSIKELLQQLTAFEPRTRYRARRELRARDRDRVLAEAATWASASESPDVWKEALWVQESFHAVDPTLVRRILSEGEFKHRAAAIHVVGNQWRFLDNVNDLLRNGIDDEHPRVRMEAVRGASLQQSEAALMLVLEATKYPTDKWLDYVISSALQSLEPTWDGPENETFIASLAQRDRDFLEEFKVSQGPGAAVYKPLKVLANVDADEREQLQALREVVAADKANQAKGKVVFQRVCAACHQHGELGKKFGPNLGGLGDRMTKHDIIASILWPNESIAKGYETVAVLDVDGRTTTGFVLEDDDDKIVLGLADGKAAQIAKDDIEVLKEMRASSMPEGLTATIAPGEFLDLLAFLMGDWVATNPNLDFGLQEFEGWTEVSRQSHVRISPEFPADLNQEAQHLLSHEGVRQFPYAIHSSNQETESPSILIRFNEPTAIRRVKVFNRREEALFDRARGITMWTSQDGMTWDEVWTSDQVAANWTFALAEDEPVYFVKFGLKRPGILHLDRVTFYGEIKPPPAESE